MRIKLSIPLSIKRICAYTSAINKGYGEEDIIEYITTDTREIEKGDLFIALIGDKYDANDFCSDAELLGAYIISSSYSGCCIKVKDTLAALRDLAKAYKKHLSSLKHTVAITGSVGKTTTKNFTAAILSGAFKTHSTKGNENNLIGAPLTILSAPADTEVLVIELGMNHLGEIERLSEAVAPDIAVITNIGSSHIGNLGSRKMIARAKCEILAGMDKGCAIVPKDEVLLSEIKCKRTVSANDADADYYYFLVSESAKESVIDFYFKDKCIQNLKIPLFGAHIIYSLALAISVAAECGLSIEDIQKGCKNIDEHSVRHKLLQLNDFFIFDDSYNSSLESVEADLAMLKTLKGHKTSALLGDIHELGAETERIHRRLGEIAYESGIEHLYIYGIYSSFVAKGALKRGMNPDKIFINTDLFKPELTAKQIKSAHTPGEIILFKASHKTNLSKIIDLLREDAN